MWQLQYSFAVELYGLEKRYLHLKQKIMTEQIFSFKNTCKSSLFQIYINMNIQLSVIVFGLLLNLIETQYNFYIILIQGV